MKKRKLYLLSLSLLLTMAIGIISPPGVRGLNGNTYNAPFSNKAPLLDAVFDDPEWALASNTTYQINSPLGYRMTGYVADFSIALLAAPDGLYIAYTLTMVALDSNGMGFNQPGFYMQFDTDMDGTINQTDFDPSEDDDFLIYATSNASLGSSSSSKWSDRDIEYAMIGDITGTGSEANLTRTLRAEVRYSYLKGGVAPVNVAVNFGIYFHQYGGYTWDVYTFMVDSGDKVYNTVRNPSLYTISSFSLLTLNPGLAIDLYPPAINLLTPVMGTNGVYNLSVAVTDVNDIVSVEFSSDGASWVSASTTDGSKYTYMWDSSGYTGSALYFRAMDNQSNVAVLTIDVTQSVPNGDYEFTAVIVDNSPPVLDLVSPSPESTITGTVIIQISALDNSSVVMVDWKIGDDTWSNMYFNPASGYWEATWDTTTMADGEYSLSFMARDSVNNSATLVGLVTVDSTSLVDTTTVTEGTTETSTEVLTEIVTETVTITDGNETNSSTDTVTVPISFSAVLVAFSFIAILTYRRK